MARVRYKLSQFDYKEAEAGHLCVVTTTNVATEGNIDNIKIGSDGKTFSVTSGFVGAGVCTLQNGTYKIVVDSTVYTFNSSGNAYDSQTSGKRLWLADIIDPYSTNPEAMPSALIAGNIIMANVKATATRRDAEVILSDAESFTDEPRRAGESSEQISTTEEQPTVIDDTKAREVTVDYLTPRDRFAIEAMKGIIGTVKDPAGLSNSVVSQYCEGAYQWASGMMVSAANARAILNDTTGSDEIKLVKIGGLETNTERLLNNIMAGLAWTETAAGTKTNYTFAKEFITRLNEYLKHTSTGTSDTQKYARFEDLTKLLKNIQETDDDKIYERVTLKDFSKLLTKVDDLNDNIVALKDAITSGMSSIASAINSLDLSPTINNYIEVPESNNNNS